MNKFVAIASVALLAIIGVGLVLNMSDKPDVFAELELKQKRLLEQLAASSEVAVVGVIDASGAGGGNLRGDANWTLRFAFAAWYRDSSEVMTDELMIQRQVSREQLDQYMERIKPYTIVRARVRLAESTEYGGPHGLLIDDVEVIESDEKLDDWVIRLQEPVTFEDKVFGTLTLDRRLDWYEGRVEWQGELITLSVSAENDGDLEKSLATAYALWQSQDDWHKRIRYFAVKRLLELKNESWLEDDDTTISAEQFKDRMKLQSITVYPGGSFEFWHDDGDLFWGHAIAVDGTLSDGPTDAGIHG